MIRLLARMIVWVGVSAGVLLFALMWVAVGCLAGDREASMVGAVVFIAALGASLFFVGGLTWHRDH